MDQKITNEALQRRTAKLSFLYVFIVAAILLFLFSILRTVANDRKMPRREAIVHDRALRGNIFSADRFTLATSTKTYTAVVRKESIDPQKESVFVKLFSIYSGMDESSVRRRLHSKKHGNIVLSKSLNAKEAMQLKTLSRKLCRLKVFRPVKTVGGYSVLYGLDIVENGESRLYPRKEILAPVVGYVRKKERQGYIRPKGMKGLEKSYNKYLAPKQDGFFTGKRDVGGDIIHDKNALRRKRIDGMDLYLNIPLSVQCRIEKMIDTMKKRLDADEILIGIMQSDTGRVLALATTERYDPAHITQKDIAALNPKFAEYPYEPGSVIKPITLSIALEHRRVTPQTVFNTYNGRMKIGKHRYVTDDDKFDRLSATEIIIHSSNVGISQIAWKLTGQEFHDGLVKFGFSKPSGIDLSRDLTGRIKRAHLLEHPLHRANSAYGYGMTATFAQLFKAYSAFNNDGVAVTPRIVNYLEDAAKKHYILAPEPGDLKAISPRTAHQIHEILKLVVQKGTGVKARYPGLEIGGKTGTAHIAKHGHYVREYHSSFYGFANDSHGHKYTIGVLVIRAKKWRKYFASQSAVPTFRNAVAILVDQGYLLPDHVEEAQENKPTHTLPMYSDNTPTAATPQSVNEPILPPPPKESAKPSAAIAKPKPRKVIPVREKPKPIYHRPKHPVKVYKPKPLYRTPPPIRRPIRRDEADDLF